MKHSLGVVRDKTHLLFKYKDDQKIQQNRFQKPNDLHVPSLRFLQQNEEANSLLIERRNGSSDSTASNYSIEMAAAQKSLPQEWAHHYEEISDKKLPKIKETINELKRLGAARLKLQFGDASKLEKQIYDNNFLATKNIKECEQHIAAIGSYADPAESESDHRIRLNIQRALAAQVSELSSQLRNQQKRTVNMLNQIHKEEGGECVKLSDQKMNEMKLADGELTQAEEQLYDDLVDERGQEIDKLVSTINDLAKIFESLNQLVMDQGAILDRIDYNLDQTIHNVKEGNKQLRKAEEYQNSPLAQRCIIALLVMIGICSLLLAIKYSR